MLGTSRAHLRLAERCARCTAEPSDSNGATAVATPEVASSAPSTSPTILHFKERSDSQKFSTSAKLAFAWPRRRFKKNSYLAIKLEGAQVSARCRRHVVDLPPARVTCYTPHTAASLECMLPCVQQGLAQFSTMPNSTHDRRCAGEIAEKKQPRLSRKPSMPALCEALRKAAYDPRITGLVLNLDLLGIGWAKAQELRKHIAFFRLSGKATVAYMKRGGEKEYYLATACDEIYVPPTAQLSLRGLSVGSAFLRGVLDKVGVEPQVRPARCALCWGDTYGRSTQMPFTSSICSHMTRQ